MADLPISGLPSAGALAGTEPIPIVQSGATKQTTVQDIADLAGTPLTADELDAIQGSSLPSSSNVFITDSAQTFTKDANNNVFYNGVTATLGTGCAKNTFYQGSATIVFGDGCTNNIVEQENNVITLGDSCLANRFGIGCGTLVFGDGCGNNIVEQECNIITLGDNCQANRFGIGCGTLVLGIGSAQNVFGNAIDNLTLGDSCANNTFENNVRNIIFGDNLRRTLVRSGDYASLDLTASPTFDFLYSLAYPSEIYLGSDGQPYHRYYDGANNQDVITLLVSPYTVSYIGGGSGSGIPKATASGTDTYTATISGVASYTDGDTYLIRFTNGNTTSATLNINSLGAKTLYRNNDGAIIGGDFWDGGEMLCVYNSTLNGFQCIGTSPNSIFAYVTNAASVSITKGQVVYAFGGTGDRMTVKLANNSTDATSARTVGVVFSASIGANQKGIIILQGLIDGLSILGSPFVDGDSVYLGSTNGSITRTKQYAPNHLVYIGTVTTASAGSAGRMYVKIQNGYEMDELHDVSAQTPANKDGLFYNTTTSLWESRQVAATDINANVSNTEFGYLDGVTGAIQTQLDAKLDLVRASNLIDIATDGAATSGTSNTYSTGGLITPSQILAGDAIEIFTLVRKSAANGTVTIRLYANTTNDLISGTPILIGASAAIAAATRQTYFTRWLRIKVKAGTGAGTEVQNTATTTQTDSTNATTAPSTLAIDWTVNQYLIVAIQNSSGSDSSVSTMLKVRR
jgi:hypothetical protein